MLQEQINKDYIQAMKDRAQVRISTLSFLRAQLKNVMIDQKTEALDDAQVIAVIKKQVKQRQDSIEQYEKGLRQDLADKERQEEEILRSYLPQEISDEQLARLLQETLAETGASSIKDMGNVMKALLPKVGGLADNQKVSRMVKDTLTQM